MSEAAGARREYVLIAAFLGVGFAASAIAYGIYREKTVHMAERPEATGEVGFVTVYADRGQGPAPLTPGVATPLSRPQDLAFQWTSRGTGPRVIRIELVMPDRKEVIEEVTAATPAVEEALAPIVRLDQKLPNSCSLVVTIEAPHARAQVTEYPLLLQ